MNPTTRRSVKTIMEDIRTAYGNSRAQAFSVQATTQMYSAFEQLRSFIDELEHAVLPTPTNVPEQPLPNAVMQQLTDQGLEQTSEAPENTAEKSAPNSKPKKQ